tara:strand:- start:1130 stop:1741 length:612 start_codon:yes stop_codon:yes gene_type:complete
MSKTKKTSNWFSKHKKDPYVKRSRKDQYRSRAVYKLKEIDEKFKILKNCNCVIDLGCAPGSWLQYLKEFKNISHIVGVDILNIDPIEGVKFLKSDINDDSIYASLNDNNMQFDLVLSDIAPSITGIVDIDQSNFENIAKSVIRCCKFILKNGGMLIIKYFLGSSFDELNNLLKKYFTKVNVFKPESSKKISKEIYLVCKGFQS